MMKRESKHGLWILQAWSGGKPVAGFREASPASLCRNGIDLTNTHKVFLTYKPSRNNQVLHVSYCAELDWQVSNQS